MSAKDEIAELVKKAGNTPGWEYGLTGRNHWKVTNPSGDFCTAALTPRGNRALADLRADLRRLGWSEDTAEVIRDEAAVAAIAADRERNERRTAEVLAMAARENAAQEAAQAALAATTEKEVVPIPPTTTTTPDEDVVDLAVYRTARVFLDHDRAAAIAQRGQCRQRHLYVKHAMKLAQAMNRGEWRENPGDSLIFDEHEEPCGECSECKHGKTANCVNPIPGCLINGQHRVYAVMHADPEALAKHYPNGVPFVAVYGYPSHLAHVLDTGRSRTAPDALAVDGLTGWNVMESAALRMALNYDYSFQRDQDGTLIGNPAWPTWRNNQWTNTELVEAAKGPYAALLDHGAIASRLHSRAQLTRTTGFVLGYLLERDNPDGGPYGTNQDFYDGVCGYTDLSPRDPRMALMRYCMRGTGKGQRAHVGVVHLAHALRRYADWNLGLDRDLSNAPEDRPMFPVWRDGMKIIGGDLRYDRRDPRATSLF